MEATVSRVTEALGWSGSGFTISLFLVADAPEPPSLDFGSDTTCPSSVHVYSLDDEKCMLGRLRVYEYDLQFNTLPTNLESYLEACLRQACDGSRRIAWLAFEGSFDFDFILADQVADQIYGVCVTDDEPTIALDDGVLTSLSWKTRLAQLRRTLRRFIENKRYQS